MVLSNYEKQRILYYRSLGNFCGKKNSCDNFSRVNFSFSGPSTKIYHGSSRKFIVHENEYGRALCVRGYHVYREIWEAAVGQVLICEREPLLPISARTLVLYLL